MSSPNPTIEQKSRGWRRMRELRAAAEEDKREIIRGLLDGLGRQPTMVDRLAAEQIASLTVWARTLERRGSLKAAAEVRDQITRAQRANNFKPEPAGPAKPADPVAALMRHLAGPDDGGAT